MADKTKTLDVLRMIQNDMENDANSIDGKPFNGKTVATYFGYQAAAIAAVAKILEKFIEENK